MKEGRIRKAEKKDLARIAEILVFNNRLFFYPIFRDEEYSFGFMNVEAVMKEYRQDPVMMNETYVYDDGLIRGILRFDGTEIIKLYVDPFFQNRGIGQKLLEFALEGKERVFLWALEKNEAGRRFYRRNGFAETGERKFEEGTEEYLIRMEYAKADV
ncbi:MAG: GNAT family N-acetyltransferase [Solobacterium sp.]|nr:GNAT family N-acetyltransferase [Solobacterium sp.]